MKTLEGKNALITGGSQGIGREIALKFASLGANIVLFYVGDDEKAQQVQQECEVYGVKTAAYHCDVSSFDAVKADVADVKKNFGMVDILVNNAGVTRDNLILMMKEADYDLVLDVNLKGAFNLIKACAPMLMKTAGRIVNISSIAGLMGNPGQANYSASKAGLIGLTKTVAKEFGSRQVTCNAIAPGVIQTDMTKAFDADSPMVKQIPLGRMGGTADIAETAAFLVSPASAYITGEVIRVDGGLAM
ncbi:MAG: 3-oxoacyl-[acyl-carrier-protein] reductase [Oscillospiraceae bacterium]|nr:3-oxoacyl-[acyl-carrier-protein] reductase [Oscillospiraceae bacterium]